MSEIMPDRRLTSYDASSTRRMTKWRGRDHPPGRWGLRAERDSGWGSSPTGSEMSEGSIKTLARRATELAGPVPCRSGDSWLWFAQDPDDLEEAKARCRRCPLGRRAWPERRSAGNRAACGAARSSTGSDPGHQGPPGRPHADRRVATRAG